MGSPDAPAKVCPTCGRSFTWRKKWAKSWDQVVHCSDRCRSSRTRTAALETTILALLAQRGRGASIDLAEVLSDPTRIEAVRAAARRLAHASAIDILQDGIVVDPDHARGPFRVRLR